MPCRDVSKLETIIQGSLFRKLFMSLPVTRYDRSDSSCSHVYSLNFVAVTSFSLAFALGQVTYDHHALIIWNMRHDHTYSSNAEASLRFVSQTHRTANLTRIIDENSGTPGEYHLPYKTTTDDLIKRLRTPTSFVYLPAIPIYLHIGSAPNGRRRTMIKDKRNGKRTRESGEGIETSASSARSASTISSRSTA